MKRERLWGTLRQVWLRARPFLVSALAVVLIALQQIYYLDDPATVVLNIILLGLICCCLCLWSETQEKPRRIPEILWTECCSG